MHTKSGFSLIESLVIISIISILTAMSLKALPTIRAHQELVSDTEAIRALLLDAKQRTINQVRPEKCLPPPISPEDPVRAGCSDTGIAFDTGDIVLFAHSTNSTPMAYDKNNDFELSRTRLASKITTPSPVSLLFVGLPPSAALYANGQQLSAAMPTSSIVLTASNGRSRTITVHPFGTIDVK